MPRLKEQLLDRPHSWVQTLGHDGKVRADVSLDQPSAYTARLKSFGPGRSEVLIRRTDLQRVLNASFVERRRGRRSKPLRREEENVFRSIKRAQQSVRQWCLVSGADRMLTFGTRAVLPLSVLLTRFQRFLGAYTHHLRRRGLPKFQYCATFERHPSNPEHFHIHCATAGHFYLESALSIWHALCAHDFVEHAVNSSINVKAFRKLRHNDDLPSIIAGYIAKYVGKEMHAAFNKRMYWASRTITKVEVNHIILESENWGDIQSEISKKLGIDWASVLVCNEGCFFILPDNDSLWLKILPHMPRTYPDGI